MSDDDPAGPAPGRGGGETSPRPQDGLSELGSADAAEQILFQAELLNTVHESVIATDMAGTVTFLNRYAEELYGWPREEAVGRNIREVTVPVHQVDRAEAIMTLLSQGQSWSGEFEVRRRDGSTFTARVTNAPIRDRDGQLVGIVGLSADVTERKRLEREVRRVANLESLSAFAGGVAHDFNNAMTGVIGNLSLLEELLPPGSEVAEIARSALEAADGTRTLANRLLTFSRGGAPSRSTVDLGQLLDRVVAAELQGASTEHRAEVDVAADVPALFLDEKQIEQALRNVVLNALQAMPRGGEVRIHADTVEPSEDVEADPGRPMGALAGASVRVTVEDDGEGIPDDILGRVFDPYFTTRAAGHGLGLAIAHSIIIRHGGTITAGRAATGGARFTLHLPVSAPSRAPLPRAASTSTAARFLLLDDDPRVRQALVRMFGQLGYVVDEARDGDEAVRLYSEAKARGERYAAVIADIWIPEGRGAREVVAELRALDPDAEVVVATGDYRSPIYYDYAQLGFTDRLAKPIDFSAVSRLVERVRARRLGGHGDA